MIARPFVGDAGALRAHANRHDFSLEPRAPELPDADPRRGPRRLRRRQDRRHLRRAATSTSRSRRGRTSRASTGRSSCSRTSTTAWSSRTSSRPTSCWATATTRTASTAACRSSTAGCRRSSRRCAPDDLLIITSDHGCDPTTPSTDHSREHALLLAYAAGRTRPAAVHEGGEFARRRRDGRGVARGRAPGRACRARRSSSDEAERSRARRGRERRRANVRLRGDEGGWRCRAAGDADRAQAERRRALSPTRSPSSSSATPADEVPDYQMAAWCMAVYFNGLRARETYALTDAMIHSGDTLDLAARSAARSSTSTRPAASGDKTSIAVAPIVAACGVPLGKMSGRGLGHTGGTLDKLEAIPGFRVELSTRGVRSRSCATVGLAIVGQSDRLVPADKKLYALRDVTGDRRHRAADRVLDHVEEACGRGGRDRARRQGRRRRLHEVARRGAIARREMIDLGRRAGREVDVPAHRHGPAARPRGRQRARDPRGARHRARRGAGRLHRARPRRLRAPARVLRSRGSTSRRDAAAPRRPLPTGARSRRTTAGSERRAATPIRGRCRMRRSRVPVAAPRDGVIVTRSVRSPWASPRSSSAPAGGRRPTRSTTRSASSASRSGATRCSRGTTSPRCTRGTKRLRQPEPRRCRRRT